MIINNNIDVLSTIRANYNMKTILNYTPHSITVVGDDGQVIRTYPSVGVARFKTTIARVDTINDIPVTKTLFGEPDGLPNGSSGVYYIVSGLIKSALTDRTDLLSPGELVRDDQGNVIGCKSLSL